MADTSFEEDMTMQPGNMDTQYAWHTAYRDSAKNMYRSSYQDMIHHRDVHVKSDFPAGYGGHNPIFRHDMRFKNTDLFKVRHLQMTDVSRDAFPSFEPNKTGVPGFCYNPRGAKQVPLLGQVPVYGLKSPWAITKPNGHLNYRKAPPMTSSMRRTASDFLHSATMPRDAYEELEPMEPAPAPTLQQSASTPALPAATHAPAPAPEPFSEPVTSPPTFTGSQKFVPNMSATTGSFGLRAGTLESALHRSLSQSSYKSAMAINAGIVDTKPAKRR
jgi:hypothetical protein